LAEEEGFEPPVESPLQRISNRSRGSADVGNRGKNDIEQCPIATDTNLEAVSKPPKALSRATLITSLYAHAAALAELGDIEAARVAHEAAGRLLAVPEPANAVVDLGQRRKP
jgi:hypothetical protein